MLAGLLPKLLWRRRRWEVHLPPYGVCPRCRFDLRGTTDRSRCTECGLVLGEETCAILATHPRPWSMILINAAVIVTLLVCLLTAFVQVFTRIAGPPAIFWVTMAPALVVFIFIRRLLYDATFLSAEGIAFYRAGIRVYFVPWRSISRVRLHGKRDGQYHPIMFSAYRVFNGFIQCGTDHAAACEVLRRMNEFRGRPG